MALVAGAVMMPLALMTGQEIPALTAQTRQDNAGDEVTQDPTEYTVKSIRQTDDVISVALSGETDVEMVEFRDEHYDPGTNTYSRIIDEAVYTLWKYGDESGQPVRPGGDREYLYHAVYGTGRAESPEPPPSSRAQCRTCAQFASDETFSRIDTFRFVFGVRTAAATDGALPSTGSATYDGDFFADIWNANDPDSNQRQQIYGDMRIVANFDARSLRGDVSNIHGTQPGETGRSYAAPWPRNRFEIRDARILNGQFSATLAGFDDSVDAVRDASVQDYQGNVLGEFYGPDAEEIGAVVIGTQDLEGEDGDRVLSGHFQTRKALPPATGLTRSPLEVDAVARSRNMLADLLPDGGNAFAPLTATALLDASQGRTSIPTGAVYVDSIQSDGTGGYRVTYVIDGVRRVGEFRSQDYESQDSNLVFTPSCCTYSRALRDDGAGPGSEIFLWTYSDGFTRTDNDGNPVRDEGDSSYDYHAVYVSTVAEIAASGTASESGNRFWFVFGVRTPAADLPAGAATYDGDFRADSWRATGRPGRETLEQDLHGAMRIVANFDLRTLEGRIENVEGTPLGMKGRDNVQAWAGTRFDIRNGRIVNGQFTATVTGADDDGVDVPATNSVRGYSGNILGEFFGPNAEEIGAILTASRDLEGTDNDQVLIGQIRGKRERSRPSGFRANDGLTASPVPAIRADSGTPDIPMALPASNVFAPLTASATRDFSRRATLLPAEGDLYVKSVASDGAGGFRVTYVIDGMDEEVHFEDMHFTAQDDAGNDVHAYSRMHTPSGSSEARVFFLYGDGFDQETRDQGRPDYAYNAIYGSHAHAEDRFWFVFGVRTPDAGLPVGTATYTGELHTDTWNSSDPDENSDQRQSVSGTVRIVANFDINELRGGVSGIHGTSRGELGHARVPWPDGNRFEIRNGRIVNGQFTATLVGVDDTSNADLATSVRGILGDILGEFHGPNADELGGVVTGSRDLDGDEHDRVLIGHLRAKKESVSLPPGIGLTDGLTPNPDDGESATGTTPTIANRLSDQTNTFAPLTAAAIRDFNLDSTSLAPADAFYVKSVASDGSNGFQVIYVIDGTETTVDFDDDDFPDLTMDSMAAALYSKTVGGVEYLLWSFGDGFEQTSRDEGDTDFDYHTMYGSNSDAGPRFWFVFGVRTPNLPTGTATYNGDFIADTWKRTDPGRDQRQRLYGNMRIVANFDFSSLAGTISRIRGTATGLEDPRIVDSILWPGSRIEIRNGRIVGGQFTATLTGFDDTPNANPAASVRGYLGNILGEFYGPDAEEIGAVLTGLRDLDGDDHDRVLVGHLRGRKGFAASPDDLELTEGLTPSRAPVIRAMAATDTTETLLPDNNNVFAPLTATTIRGVGTELGSAGDLYVKSVSSHADDAFTVVYVFNGVETTIEFAATDIADGADGYSTTVNGVTYSLWSYGDTFVREASDQTPRNQGDSNFDYHTVYGSDVHGSGIRSARFWFVFGARAPDSALTGVLEYNGDFFADAWSSSNSNIGARRRLHGGMRIVANFDVGSLVGRIGRIRGTDPGVLGSDNANPWSLANRFEIRNGRIVNGQFTATVVGVDERAVSDAATSARGYRGNLLGEFFGNNGQEIGAILNAKRDLAGTENDRVLVGQIRGDTETTPSPVGSLQPSDGLTASTVEVDDTARSGQPLAALLPDSANAFAPLTAGVNRNFVSRTTSIPFARDLYVKSISSDGFNGFMITYVINGEEQVVHFMDDDFDAHTSRTFIKRDVDGVDFFFWSHSDGFDPDNRALGDLRYRYHSVYGSSAIDRFWFVFGVRTPSADLPAGTFTYSGDFFADSWRRNDPDLSVRQRVYGDVRLIANFDVDSLSITGEIGNIRGTPPGFIGFENSLGWPGTSFEIRNGEIVNGQFTAELVGINTNDADPATSVAGYLGKILGEFYGPDAAEAAAVLNASRDLDGSRHDRILTGQIRTRQRQIVSPASTAVLSKGVDRVWATDTITVQTDNPGRSDDRGVTDYVVNDDNTITVTYIDADGNENEVTFAENNRIQGEASSFQPDHYIRRDANSPNAQATSTEWSSSYLNVNRWITGLYASGTGPNRNDIVSGTHEYFIRGVLTAPADMPTTGTARYAGRAAATEWREASDSVSVLDNPRLRGDLRMTADFQNSRITGAIENIARNPDLRSGTYVDIDDTIDFGPLTITGNSFSGAVTGQGDILGGYTGTASGRFFGPDAAEAGSLFQATRTNDDSTVDLMNGWFAGSKQP